MNKADAKKSPTRVVRDKKPGQWDWSIGIQLLDTSWRVALPILLLSYIGIRLDRYLDSAPLYTLIGFFLSLMVATLLVYKQIKQLYPEFFKGSKK